MTSHALSACPRVRLLAGGLLLVLLSSVTPALTRAADVELICPCEVASSDQTAISITAGIRNRDTGGSSGSLRYRVVAHPTPNYFDSSFYTVGTLYLPSTLAGGFQFNSDTWLAGFDPPPEGVYYYTLLLDEYTASGWTRRDSVRMHRPARSLPLAGSSWNTQNLIFDGRVTARVEGSQITVNLPDIRNLSSSWTSGSLSLQVRQKNSGGSYYTLSTIPLGTSLPPSSFLAAHSVTGSYTEYGATGFDYFEIALVDSSTQATQLYATRNGAPFVQRRFSLQGIDVLSDSDSDSVTDYNEELAGTDSGNAADTPGNAVVRVMVYYSDELAGNYAPDPVTRIEHLIAVGNQVLADSGVAINLELAGTPQEIDLAPGASNGSVLSEMNSQSGVFTGLNTTRQTLLADAVLTMQLYNNDGNCGIASLTGADDEGDLSASYMAELANGVISIDCGDTTTIHELGHIFGLSHSRIQVASGGGPGTFDWSTGHGVSGSFVTIMPYASFFGGATEVAMFSTPLLECAPGLACGVDRSDLTNGADAAFALNVVSGQLAAFSRDSDGDGTADALDGDDDGDGTPDSADEAPLDPNDDTDTDLDGLANYIDPDDDNDGVLDVDEPGLGTNSLNWDSDGDGVLDGVDAFPAEVAASVDADRDGLPDAWYPGCNTTCQTNSGLVLDDDPTTAASDCPGETCPSWGRGWRAVLLRDAP